VIRLGLRLTLNGGKEAVIRLALIGVAVAIGVCLLLVTLSGIHAVDAQNQRYAWLETGLAPDSFTASLSERGDSSSTDPLWWMLRRDSFDGEDIGRIDIAATGPDSPVPPGLAALPAPGEYYASPALGELLGSTASEQLSDRFDGVQVGTIGEPALPAPDSLLVIVGHDADDLAHHPDAVQVTSISATSPSDCGSDCGVGFGISSDGISLVLSVVGAALLFPVLIFIGSATRLSAARREQRFAAMRLVGATPRQISVLSAVESSAAAVIGVAAGFGLFLALRSTIAAIPFTGAPFFTSDLSLSLADVLLVALGVPVAAAVAARVALRRVRISPLGVNRHTTPRPPGAWRIVPLAAGIAELGYFAVVGRPQGTNGQLAAYLPGVLATMAGLVIAGPWLTMLGSRLMARRADRPAGLIAGRRLSDNPRAGFRAISGLVIALFVGSTAIGTITTVVDASHPDGGEGGTLVQRFDEPLPVAAMPAATLDELRSILGVDGVTMIHASPAPPDGPGPRPTVVSCADLAGTPSLGRCPDGADTVRITSRFGGSVIEGAPSQADEVWPAADISTDELRRLPVDTIVVGNDGSTQAIEQARTVLEVALPQRFAPETVAEINSHGSRDLAQYQQLANVVVAASLAIAGCSLAVGVAAGLSDRRRPFSLLRLTGVPLAMLRRVVALETVVPLVVTAVVAAGTGFLTAQLVVRAQMDRTLQPPGADYYMVVLGGLVASLAVIASTLPLLNRITGPETARNE
jgi:FtsX-like permease family